MELYVQCLRSGARMPYRATPDSAGMDVYACLEHDVVMQPGDIQKIPTGLAVAPSRKDVALLLFPRSGLSTKYGITLANSVGLIDSDYRGELLVALIHLGKEPFTVQDGMRIAQLVCVPILVPELKQTEQLDATQRGAGGFGASGLT